ncbi:MAG: hypothetical protein ABW352_20315 [Polyangiales bacterium]
MLLYGLGLVFSASTAHAYGYLEHQRLGHDAYLHACSLLRRQFHGNRRLEMACPDDAYQRELRASAYGQGVALSADHVAKPDWFTDTSGLREAQSVFKYLLKALENAEHFHPTNTLKWHKLHQCAVEAARGEYRECWKSTPRVVSQTDDEAGFMRILYLSAFADHFLQDAFAAGHMGFNRPASAPVASMLHHDYYSAEGRTVRSSLNSPALKEWTTFGDNHLCDSRPELSPRAASRQAVFADSTAGNFDGALWESVTCEADRTISPQRLAMLQTAHSHVYSATTRSILEVLVVSIGELDIARVVRNCAPTSSMLCALLREPAQRQVPVAYRDDEDGELTSLGDLSRGASVLFAPVVEMRFADGITGNRKYGYWMPAFGFRILTFELIAGYATPTIFRSREAQLWDRQNSSVYGRFVVETPPANPYGSALAFSFLLGPIGERCVQNCSNSKTDDNWRLGLTGGVRVTVEAAIAAISFSAEPFVSWNAEGDATFGVAVATSLSKPLVFRGTLRGGGRFHGPAF